jgi:signal transduction histidine kinase
MIGKQMETAINKAKTIEQLLNTERINSGKKLSDVILNEVRVPIEIIESYVRILNSKDLPHDTDDLIRMIQKQASSITDLTDSLLEVLVDEPILNDSKVHFNEFIDDVLELLSEYCESKEVKLFKKIGDGAVVEIDRSKLYTAILQLIKAAILDSRKGDRVYFSTELSGDSISILIQNEGKGAIAFPEEELFNYFYSNENPKQDEIQLLLAKKIITAHSGQVEVESIKGVGSTIKIILPVAH